jgi:rubrerythrin
MSVYEELIAKARNSKTMVELASTAEPLADALEASEAENARLQEALEMLAPENGAPQQDEFGGCYYCEAGTPDYAPDLPLAEHAVECLYRLAREVLAEPESREWRCSICGARRCGRQCGECGRRPCDHDQLCPSAEPESREEA